MKELAVAPPEASSASAVAIAKPAEKPARSKLPVVALGAGAIVALVALVLTMGKTKPKEPEVLSSPPAPASTPAIVVSSLIVESKAPPADPPRASVAPSAKPLVKKAPPKAAPSVDPASFQ